MLVLLGVLLVGDAHPLAGQLLATEEPGAGDDVVEGVVGFLGDEVGAEVVGVRCPRIDEPLEVLEQEIAGHGEVGQPPVGVGGVGVVA